MRERESRAIRGGLRDRRRAIRGELEERREALHLAQVEIVIDRRSARPPVYVSFGMPIAACGMHAVAVGAHSATTTAHGGTSVCTGDAQL